MTNYIAILVCSLALACQVEQVDGSRTRLEQVAALVREATEEGQETHNILGKEKHESLKTQVNGTRKALKATEGLKEARARIEEGQETHKVLGKDKLENLAMQVHGTHKKLDDVGLQGTGDMESKHVPEERVSSQVLLERSSEVMNNETSGFELSPEFALGTAFGGICPFEGYKHVMDKQECMDLLTSNRSDPFEKCYTNVKTGCFCDMDTKLCYYNKCDRQKGEPMLQHQKPVCAKNPCSACFVNYRPVPKGGEECILLAFKGEELCMTPNTRHYCGNPTLLGKPKVKKCEPLPKCETFTTEKCPTELPQTMVYHCVATESGCKTRGECTNYKGRCSEGLVDDMFCVDADCAINNDNEAECCKACENKYDNDHPFGGCSKLAKNFCQTNAEWARINCRETCGYCRKAVVARVADDSDFWD